MTEEFGYLLATTATRTGYDDVYVTGTANLTRQVTRESEV